MEIFGKFYSMKQKKTMKKAGKFHYTFLSLGLVVLSMDQNGRM